MSGQGTVVVGGAGHAGVHAVASLRNGGYSGDLVLLDLDSRLPMKVRREFA